jgi:hypothetical protein
MPNKTNNKTQDMVEAAAANIVEGVDAVTDNQAVKNFAAGVATGVTIAIAAVKIGADIAKGD